MTLTTDQVQIADPTATCSAQEIAAVWERCDAADPTHPYLLRHHVPRLTLRQVDDYLVAPLHDRHGGLSGLRLVDGQGEEDAWPKTASVLPYIMEHAEAHSTIIVRGALADAMAIHVACRMQVLHIPMAADASALREAMLAAHPRRTVLIAETSMAAAAAYGHAGQRLHHIVVPPYGLSWSQLHVAGGVKAVRSWIEDPIALFAGVTTPSTLMVRSSGTWLGATRIGGPVAATDLAHDEGQDRWRRVVYIQDRDGRDRVLLIPEQQMLLKPGQVLARLIEAGLEINDPGAAAYLVAHLARTQVKQRLIVVQRGGWHGEHYLGGAGTIGPDGNTLPVLNGNLALAPPASSEALAVWQQTIAVPAEGNSRLVAALGVAFAGLAIGLLPGQIGIGLHLRGLSSVGKTTALRVAASVYGPSRDHVRSWRSTDSGLETMAVQHHHRALVLDELAQISADAAAQAAYILANGAGRQRANGAGRALPQQSWQLTFLSSGEIALEDKVAERAGSPTVREGQAVRLIELPADAGHGHGIFENLHGCPDGAALSDALSRAAEMSTGDVAKAFAQALARDIVEARSTLVNERERFIRDHLPAQTDGIVRRVYANLGLLAAACEVATQAGVLPWRPGSGRDGIAVGARAWLEVWRQRSQAQSPLAAARVWLADHREKLTPWTLAAQEENALGYIRLKPAVFYLRAEGWRRLCGDLGSEKMQAALTEAQIYRYANARPPGGKPGKYYTIYGALIDGGV
ncbi:TOPRIM and DUF927 domain-containing protein [Devosia sp.]|uniref:TOPRIM and DUF927 domain-containing protein n=1 Tax=Devosia sp. TaxID=1871048 RepID=UPI002FCC8701